MQLIKSSLSNIHNLLAILKILKIQYFHSLLGNMARFVNHSCDPNLDTKVVFDEQTKTPHLIFYSNCKIEPGEELTAFYGENWWKLKKDLKCTCGSKNCYFN